MLAMSAILLGRGGDVGWRCWVAIVAMLAIMAMLAIYPLAIQGDIKIRHSPPL